MQSAKEAGAEVIVKSGRTLWHSHEVVKANGGKPTITIAQLQSAEAKVGYIEALVGTPKSLPDPGELMLDFDQTQPEVESDFNEKYRDINEAS